MRTAGDRPAPGFEAWVGTDQLSTFKGTCHYGTGHHGAIGRGAIHIAIAGMVHLHGTVRGLPIRAGGMRAARLNAGAGIVGN